MDAAAALLARMEWREIGSGMLSLSSTLTPTETRPARSARLSIRQTSVVSRLVTTVAPFFRNAP